MSTENFVVFVGGTASLSSELLAIGRRTQTVVVAPAAVKGKRGINERSLQAAQRDLAQSLRERPVQSDWARLTVWAYQPSDENAVQAMWRAFGTSGWIEYIPRDLMNRDVATRAFIESRIKDLEPRLHELAYHVFRHRKTSPISLPLRNFRSGITEELSRFWYRGRTLEEIRKDLNRYQQKLRQAHRHVNGKHSDDRSLIFSPAQDGECHGKPHPTGDNETCFLSGRFRFGTALFPGFHYDVGQEGKLLDCTLIDCDGKMREMKPEKRKHINIFPNDYLLPAK
jgi:hypothetical protein